MSTLCHSGSSAPVRGVNVVVRKDGSEIHIDDIATSAQGQAILDEVDTAILAIEDQIDNDHRRGGEDWRRRANTAHRKKRRIRPALQRRIAELRRSEEEGRRLELATAAKSAASPGHARCDDRRKAFINAAEELLDAELFTEIWARAAELKPAVFAEAEASHE